MTQGPAGGVLSAAVFDLDVDAAVARLEEFIASRMTALGRLGVLVPLSGGLDSSTVAALCVRAVGAEQVTALLLPDRAGAPDALRFGRLVADQLGIRRVEIDVTRLNRAAGVYRFAGYRLPRPVVAFFTRRKASRRGESLFVEELRGSDSALVRRALASIYARQRLRLVVVYRYAELHRLLVAGSAHQSEDQLGLFVKFGVDDCADVMPLKALYRTQILAIARAIGVPGAVVSRTPNPEMLPGIEDKYLDIFHVPAPTADLILWGIGHGMADAEIAAQVGVRVDRVAELREARRLSAHMREPSQHPTFRQHPTFPADSAASTPRQADSQPTVT